ncbi:Hint domain-containing protein [Rhodalgimonas zhirmunskyi]|uniref:Hint domain-containing protein n=1 Tax=Rhodalgimonas zhirmunskyi TaxID=2964767 RepID=A0AAJ1UFV2_9RHOB|nr:Hint domain-containing protein [Rhodoalgimonas zhirmunskyi]MDQ2095352.1 Hint domain-containing protein [Rhodoalgimonas zhirmunskyi]
MTSTRPAQTLSVYRADMFPSVNGANMGDPLSFAEELVPEDGYALTSEAALLPLTVHPGESGRFTIAAGSQTGTPGATLVLDSVLTFMTRKSEMVELLVLVEVDAAGNVAEIYAHPLAPMQQKTDYLLVTIDRDTAIERFAQLACVSFTRGTHITMATGEQRPVEALHPGDRILTRDDGVQEIRWIGHTTTRALGAFAPILISEGALHNTRDLLVAPDHRLFIYQRSDQLGAGRSELLVKARHLVNDETITVQQGGFVDYYQILFDTHQIIYAEGIAAETLLADPRTRPALPRNIAEAILARHGRDGAAHSDIELGQSLLDRSNLGPNLAHLLKRASIG